MSKRLVKIAKELNVGTATIVEYLINNGFELENKPTAKVTDEMYDALLKEFSRSMEEKEKADRLIIGSRVPQDEKVEVAAAPQKVSEPIPAPPKKEEKVEEPEIEKEEVVRVETPQVKIKVVDKIDLEPEVKEVEKEEEEKPTPEQTQDNGSATEKQQEAKPEKEPEDLIRAETPQLKGLKVMGKIDADKLVEKPKKEAPQKGSAVKDTAPRQDAESDKKKRKRKRKKITAENYKAHQQRKPKTKGRDDDVQKVSAKEIEEKIKATMARISGGKSSKRQKIRRDSRETKREKQEIMESLTDSEAIQITEFITVSELASVLDMPVTDIITTCMNLGVIVSINQRLDAEIIELIAEEYEKEIEFISAEDQTDGEEEEEDDPKDLKPRAPIVTVMGHVDHGKTSLLDFIRNANVVSGEAGGITQHIGAYEVTVDNKKITFLDTPGHEAFTAMRARGAKVTDVVVIIIAADDKIMPQTKEAISHAQAAGVPMVFAINKIDKPGANPEKIKEELASMNLLVEEWGGTYQSQDISAKTGIGIDELLEKIVLEAEVLELMANPDKLSTGTVVEASLDKGRGYVTKVLVQNGTMSIGDVVVAGAHSGKVKAMFNERGTRVKKAGPSTPVLMLGLSGAPQAGEKFKVVDNEQEARQMAAKRLQIEREQTNRASKRISLDEIGRRLALGNFKELNLIVKGDVDGSVEALSDSLIKLSVENIQVNVIHKAVGQIIESDVLLASASDAIIIGFQVRPSGGARSLAEKEGVQIKIYSIIYEAIDEIKMAMEGMLEPTKEEKITAEIEVRNTFKISKIGTVAGCFVTSGSVNRNTHVRIIRDGIVVFPIKEGSMGEISTLKRFKDDVKEVKSGLECGITIKNFNDIKVGDIIEGYDIIEIKQTLD
jgi:translation initiation factor IF-2